MQLRCNHCPNTFRTLEELTTVSALLKLAKNIGWSRIKPNGQVQDVCPAHR